MPRRGSIDHDIKVVQGDGTDLIRHMPPQRRALQAVVRRGTMQTITLRRHMPFRELQQILLQLGFKQVREENRFTAFSEAESGALVLLPAYAEGDEVRIHHLAALKKLLVEKGLVESVIAIGLDR